MESRYRKPHKPVVDGLLIVNPDTSIVAAIELDDRSHERPDRRAADARKAHALKSAGIPLLRWRTRQLPDATEIAAVLYEICAGAERTAGRGLQDLAKPSVS